VDPAAFTDDGATISSYVYFGPFPLGDQFTTGIWAGMEMTLGAGNANCDYSLLVGPDAEAAFNSAAAFTGTFTTGGRQSRTYTRARGQIAYLKLSNTLSGVGWAYERGAAIVLPGGQNRG
jgi:hypothetical protein